MGSSAKSREGETAKARASATPLLFAAGKLGREVVAAFAQPYLSQPVPRGLAGAIAAKDFQRQHDVFLGGQVRHQLEVLKDKATVFTAQSGSFILAANR